MQPPIDKQDLTAYRYTKTYVDKEKENVFFRTILGLRKTPSFEKIVFLPKSATPI